MLLTTKLNDTAHKMMWSEAVHTCNHMQKSMATTGSTNIPFEILYGEKPKIIGSFSDFGRIGYVTKRENFKKQMTEKHLRQSWWDIPIIIQGVRTSCATQKQRES